MRQFSLLLCFGLAAACSSAYASGCAIQDQRVEGNQISQTVTGRCSNNGKTIRCQYQHDQGWTCDGPHGRRTDMGDDPGLLISEVCGCGLE